MEGIEVMFMFIFRVGNLGQTATHAVLLAQLVTPDGVSRGLHSFVVPIRDRKTLMTFPGVVAGDMGAKASDINEKASETFGYLYNVVPVRVA